MSRVEKLEQALLHILYMDCYTRENEDMPHVVMKKIARDALNRTPLKGAEILSRHTRPDND